jgi:hypothetical protein
VCTNGAINGSRYPHPCTHVGLWCSGGPRWTRTTYLRGTWPRALHLDLAGTREPGALQPVLCGTPSTCLDNVLKFGLTAAA